MVKLINNSITETALELEKAMSSDAKTINSGRRVWLEDLQYHLANKRPNGAYPKYSMSRLRWLLNFLGPKYLIE